jgi:drug/metabolite transporter (DMT)-like permease
MSLLALSLVLAAAGLHATWNLYAKRASGGLAFVCLVGVVNVVLYAPFVAAYWLWRHPVLPESAILWIVGSGLLKTAYALFLQRGYRTGDFSLIYPLARGTGPVLSVLAAACLLGERPTTAAICGGCIIVASIFFLTGGPALLHKAARHKRVAVTYGLTTGAFIAAYTVWDRHGVASLAIAPILYDAGTTVTGVILLAPFAMRQLPEFSREWREHKVEATAVAGLSSISYILVLTALAVTPVSYIAPVREVSIVFGAFIGVRKLGEVDGRRRILAAAAIAVGIFVMAVAS